MSDEGRIEKLAGVIDKQQEQIEQLQKKIQGRGPSRRRVLQAGGVAALLGAGATGGAAAAPGDDGDTVWGSDSNRDDYYADEVDANTVIAEYIQNSLTTTSSDEVSHTRYVGPDDPTTVSEFDVQDGDVWIEVSG